MSMNKARRKRKQNDENRLLRKDERIKSLQSRLSAIKKQKHVVEAQIKLARKKGKAFPQPLGMLPRLHAHLNNLKQQEERVRQLISKNMKKRNRMSEPAQNRKKLLSDYAIQKGINSELMRQDELLGQLTGVSIELGEREKSAETSGDLFISHASEDKESFVKPLADALIERGVSVWYDEYSLPIGDSLRESIDKGLHEARYGLVVLSKKFFEGNWTKYELNGLVAKEMTGKKLVLPIWHHITADGIMEFSPTLADKVALNSALMTIGEIANKIAEKLRRPNKANSADAKRPRR